MHQENVLVVDYIQLYEFFNQTISEFTECRVTAFHLMNIFKLNHYVIIYIIQTL